LNYAFEKNCHFACWFCSEVRMLVFGYYFWFYPEPACGRQV
jgi:hypothetical protein